MKNVLVPSNFKIDSLECLSFLVKHFPEDKLNIIVFHAFFLSDSITDLLMLSQRQRDYMEISDEFRRYVSDLKCRLYKYRIEDIEIKCFYGSTVAVFKNFLQANKIDLIAYREDYEFKRINKYSIDLRKMIEKCGTQVFKVPLLSAPDEATLEVEALLEELEIRVTSSL